MNHESASGSDPLDAASPGMLLQALVERGIRVTAVDDGLEIDAPVDSVTPAIAATLRQRKPELLRWLHSDGLPGPESRQRPDRLPMSFAQERLYFVTKAATPTSTYNVPIAWRIGGDLRRDVLQRAIQATVDRHEVLRTALRQEDGELLQVIEPRVAVELPVEDLTDLDGPAAWRECNERIQRAARQPFDIEQAPLLRARLWRVDAETHVLLVVFHHAVTDGASHSVFEHELQQHYTAELIGDQPVSLPTPIQYGDYARWERASDNTEAIAFWQRHLQGELPVLAVGCDRTRSRQRSGAGAVVRADLPGEWGGALAEMARQAGATPFMAGLAVYVCLLHKLSGQTEFVIGTPVSTRLHQRLQDAIGFFVNMLPLRLRVERGSTFKTLLTAVRDTCAGAFAHQSLPFDHILRLVETHRDASRTPVFQCIFAFENDAGEATAGSSAGLQIARRWPVHPGGSRTDLALWLRAGPTGLQATLEYDSELWDSASAQRMLVGLRTIVGAVVTRGDMPIATIDAMDDAERRRVLSVFNDTGKPYPREQSLVSLFRDVVARQPQATALVSAADDGEPAERLDYAELDRRSDRLAVRLQRDGVGSGDFVAIEMPRCSAMIIAILGVLKAGGAYVPIDPELPAARRRWIVDDARPEAVLGRADVEVAEPTVEDLATLRGSTGSGEDPCYMMYTSGSTGTPKGVVVPHRAVSRLVIGSTYARLDASRVLLHMAPASFDAATFEIWGALLHGATCVLAPGRGMPELETLRRTLRSNGVTTMWLTASLFNAIIDEDSQVLACVSEVLTGGEALSVPHVRRARRDLPGTIIINGYGPTEATTFTCCYRIEEDVREDVTSIPIGRPIANTKVYIVDAHDRPVPIGVAGEILIGGDGVALGYFGRPELDAERFIADPFTQPSPNQNRQGQCQARLYRSGDYGRFLEDGRIEFLGRRDEQVKLRGFRIELGEVEAALLAVPGVEQAVAVLQRHPVRGARLLAFVVGSTEGAAALAELRQTLPGHMLPASIVALATLPLTANGKVDRRALLDSADDSVHDGQKDGARSHQEPTDAVEADVLSIWRAMLAAPKIGLGDDFFSVGGHSLLALRLLARVNRKFGVDLLLTDLLRQPTAGACVVQVKAQQRPGAERVPTRYVLPLRQNGDGSPLFIVHGAYGNVMNFKSLAQHLDVDRPIYAIQSKIAGGDLEPHRSIEEMATAYLAEVRSIQSAGPYCIGGFSSGGVIAHEMGRMLIEQGEQVSVLLLDTYPPAAIGSSGGASRADLGDRLRGHLSGLRRSGIGFLVSRLRRRLRQHVFDVRIAVGLRRRKMPLVVRQEFAFRSSAAASYVARPSTAETFLFRALGEVAASGITQPTRGWERLAHGTMRVIDVPGDHHTMLREPNVLELARVVGSVLAQAGQERAGQERAGQERAGVRRAGVRP